jgi:hypothetical protein
LTLLQTPDENAITLLQKAQKNSALPGKPQPAVLMVDTSKRQQLTIATKDR